MPRALAEVTKPISPRDRAGVPAFGDTLAAYGALRRLPTFTDSPKPQEEPKPEPKPVEVPGPIRLPAKPSQPGGGQPQGLYTEVSMPHDKTPQTPVLLGKKKDKDDDSQRVSIIPEEDDTWGGVIGGRSGSTQRATRENPNPSNTPPPPPSPYKDKREKKP